MLIYTTSCLKTEQLRKRSNVLNVKCGSATDLSTIHTAKVFMNGEGVSEGLWTCISVAYHLFNGCYFLFRLLWTPWLWRALLDAAGFEYPRAKTSWTKENDGSIEKRSCKSPVFVSGILTTLWRVIVEGKGKWRCPNQKVKFFIGGKDLGLKVPSIQVHDSLYCFKSRRRLLHRVGKAHFYIIFPPQFFLLLEICSSSSHELLTRLKSSGKYKRRSDKIR